MPNTSVPGSLIDGWFSISPFLGSRTCGVLILLDPGSKLTGVGLGWLDYTTTIIVVIKIISSN